MKSLFDKVTYTEERLRQRTSRGWVESREKSQRQKGLEERGGRSTNERIIVSSEHAQTRVPGVGLCAGRSSDLRNGGGGFLGQL